AAGPRLGGVDRVGQGVNATAHSRLGHFGDAGTLRGGLRADFWSFLAAMVGRRVWRAMNFSVHVEVRGLPGIADPEGRTIEPALPALGFTGVSSVRVGKVIAFALEAPD